MVPTVGNNSLDRSHPSCRYALNTRGSAWISILHPARFKVATHPLRELRIQPGGNPFRVFYAFDPLRQAVLLLGEDKTGDKRFYDRMIPEVEQIWEQYLQEEHYDRT